MERDQYVNFYHVISENSKKQLKKYTKKKIISIPFEADNNMWFPINNKTQLKTKLNIPTDKLKFGLFSKRY